ncbi:MAG: hypothetical protein LBT00_10400 [Spirochaetaceae bacterium]|jgi:hypothetical protein|nr:hypothetical protein [Spirochaetaceae bacterium]
MGKSLDFFNNLVNTPGEHRLMRAVPPFKMAAAMPPIRPCLPGSKIYTNWYVFVERGLFRDRTGKRHATVAGGHPVIDGRAAR